MEKIKETPLIEEHRKLNAKISPFGGWNMPIFYTGIIEERRHCREKACIFDISHMGEFVFNGNIAKSSIETAITQSVTAIPVGRSSYGFILNETGGIIDDLIVFKLDRDKLMLVVNAATIENDFKVIKNRLSDGEFKNISSGTAKLDLQGPLARDVIRDVLGLDMTLKFFNFSQIPLHPPLIKGGWEDFKGGSKEKSLPPFNKGGNKGGFTGENILISRTGYTGELGYEIFTSNNMAVTLWKKFIADERVKPAGLGARDILRLEMGYSLYGHDIDENTSPLEAGLGKFINFDKEFIGKDALLKERKKGLKKVKIAFKTNSRRVPREHYKIFSGSREIGTVTSGSFSPVLSCGIGMGYVEPGFDRVGSNIVISNLEAEIVALPFYKNGSLRR